MTILYTAGHRPARFRLPAVLATCVLDFTTLASLTQRVLPGLGRMLQSSMTSGSCRAFSALAGHGSAVRRPAQTLHRHMCLPKVVVIAHLLWRIAVSELTTLMWDCRAFWVTCTLPEQLYPPAWAPFVTGVSLLITFYFASCQCR